MLSKDILYDISCYKLSAMTHPFYCSIVGKDYFNTCAANATIVEFTVSTVKIERHS